MRAQSRATAYAVLQWAVAAVLLTDAVLLGAGPLSTCTEGLPQGGDESIGLRR